MKESCNVKIVDQVTIKNTGEIKLKLLKIFSKKKYKKALINNEKNKKAEALFEEGKEILDQVSNPKNYSMRTKEGRGISNIINSFEKLNLFEKS